jgi:hypothetical protein
MSNPPKCTDIQANADVSGIGIRVSVYITTLIIALIPNVEETKELRGALMTAAGLNGFALLVRVPHQIISFSFYLPCLRP